MPDLWMNVDAALSEVPVNKFPLIDDTDMKTREESVVYNQSGLDLLWNFVTTAGAMTQTAVTPTDTAGDYDWVNQGNGFYTIEIPASGGASANNDTEGFGWFSGFATGILPWVGPTIGFRAAALNDALIDGGDNLDVNVTQWLGTAPATPTVAGVPEVDLTHVAGATTNVAALATNVDAILTDTSTTLDNLVDDLESRLGTPSDLGSGATIAANLADIEAQTDDIGVAGAGLTEAGGTGDHLTAVPWNAAWDAEVQSEVTDALNAYDPPTHAETLALLTTAMTESYAAAGATMTMAQFAYMVRSALNNFAHSGTTQTRKKLDGSTTANTLTLDSATSPTSLVEAT